MLTPVPQSSGWWPGGASCPPSRSDEAPTGSLGPTPSHGAHWRSARDSRAVTPGAEAQSWGRARGDWYWGRGGARRQTDKSGSKETQPRAPRGRGGAGRGGGGKERSGAPPHSETQLSGEGKGDAWGGAWRAEWLARRAQRGAGEAEGRRSGWARSEQTGGGRTGGQGLLRAHPSGGPTQGPKHSRPNRSYGRSRQGKTEPAWDPKGADQTPCIPYCLSHRLGRGPWDCILPVISPPHTCRGQPGRVGWLAEMPILVDLCTGPPSLLHSPLVHALPKPRTTLETHPPHPRTVQSFAQEGGPGKASITFALVLLEAGLALRVKTGRAWLGRSARPHSPHCSQECP